MCIKEPKNMETDSAITTKKSLSPGEMFMQLSGEAKDAIREVIAILLQPGGSAAFMAANPQTLEEINAFVNAISSQELSCTEGR